MHNNNVNVVFCTDIYNIVLITVATSQHATFMAATGDDRIRIEEMNEDRYQTTPEKLFSVTSLFYIFIYCYYCRCTYMKLLLLPLKTFVTIVILMHGLLLAVGRLIFRNHYLQIICY